MLVEKRICDVDGKLIIYHENLKRLRKRLEVLKQIHDAPNIYAFLVVCHTIKGVLRDYGEYHPSKNINYTHSLIQ
jgi:hypothetical protein